MGRGRPITTKTRLGRAIIANQLKVYDVSARAQIYPRLMTEYVQGRRIIILEHAERLAKVLNCKPDDLIEPNLTRNLTEVTGRVRGNPTMQVRELNMEHLESAKSAPQFRNAHTPIAPDKLIRSVG